MSIPGESPRGFAAAAFAEPASAAAWRTKPAWGVVSTADHTSNPEVKRFGYRRAGMKQIELYSPHLVMLSHPKAVADVIREAVRADGSIDGDGH
ncbi:alpha/beta fold hydrolase [Amycolatopsis sp. lyj-108]|uniref:alpha/beta fold hydrolase n=1 Tax=Amycolatopsis sp. lyj-108 TaxID=2789286 RepID=UPI003978D110